MLALPSYESFCQVFIDDDLKFLGKEVVDKRAETHSGEDMHTDIVHVVSIIRKECCDTNRDDIANVEDQLIILKRHNWLEECHCCWEHDSRGYFSCDDAEELQVIIFVRYEHHAKLNHSNYKEIIQEQPERIMLAKEWLSDETRDKVDDDRYKYWDLNVSAKCIKRDEWNVKAALSGAPQ